MNRFYSAQLWTDINLWYDTSGAIVNDRRLNEDPERGMTHMTKYDFFTIVFLASMCVIVLTKWPIEKPPRPWEVRRFFCLQSWGHNRLSDGTVSICIVRHPVKESKGDSMNRFYSAQLWTDIILWYDTGGAIVNDRRLNKDPERGGSDDEIRFFYSCFSDDGVHCRIAEIANRKTALALES